MKNINTSIPSNPSKEKYRQVIKELRPFCKKDISKARMQFFVTVFMLYSLFVINFFVYDISIYLSLILAPAITAFLCRCHVILHDCGHQSFFRSKLTNAIAGNIITFPIMIPYGTWKYIHENHHMYVGNLDKRELNPEVWTMTVNEYIASPFYKKLLYRFFRSRFSKFFVTPWLMFGIILKIPNPKFDKKANLSVIIYNVLYVAILVFLLSFMSFQKLFFIYLIPLLFFYFIASYVFYIQHQFEDTYWENNTEWSFEDAGFKGSTYITSPAWFSWISGNVGSHNIHHLISAIPNYNLPKAQKSLENILEFKPITLYESYKLFDYKLWSEDKKKLVKFSDI